MARDPYSRWQPLATGQIRLMRLSRDDDDKTSFELEVHDIDTAPAFAALSYVCGAEEPSCNLTLNVSKASAANRRIKATWSTSITPNLERTLAQLSNFSRNTKRYLGHNYLWVDAICIDQTNLQEKSVQVSSMYKIYTAAQEVLICIGQEEDSSSEIIAVLNKVAVYMGYVHNRPADARPEPGGIISPTNILALATTPETARPMPLRTPLQDLGLPAETHLFWQALKRVFFREWFWRLWTFQEAMLAQRGYVVCGDQGIQWDHLLRISGSLRATGLMTVSLSGTHLPKRLENAPRAPASPIWDFQDNLDGSGRIYCWHVNAARSREVAEPRDRVYGVLSLAPSHLRQRIDVDYTIPLPRLYTAFTRALLSVNAHALYHVFRMIDSVDRLPGLPSWCPDSSQLPKGSNFASFPLSVGVTSGSSLGSEEDIFEPALLVEGAKFDAVEAVVPAFEMDWDIANGTAPDNAYKAMLGWLEACWLLVQERGVEETDHLFVVFTSIILAEVSLPERYPKETVEGLRALRRYLNDRVSDQWNIVTPVLARLHHIWRNHIFSSTVHGDFGIATHQAQVGDNVCVFFGDAGKYLLRPSNQTYEFVSNAYVGSISHGDNASIVKSDLTKEVFTIV